MLRTGHWRRERMWYSWAYTKITRRWCYYKSWKRHKVISTRPQLGCHKQNTTVRALPTSIKEKETLLGHIGSKSRESSSALAQLSKKFSVPPDPRYVPCVICRNSIHDGTPSKLSKRSRRGGRETGSRRFDLNIVNQSPLLVVYGRKRKSYASGSHLKRCIKEGLTPTAARVVYDTSYVVLSQKQGVLEIQRFGRKYLTTVNVHLPIKKPLSVKKEGEGQST
eukprot:1138636-Pelagomonas_calceolata.AAC.1